MNDILSVRAIMKHRSVIIHPGLKKAGSTAIQAFLSENENVLLKSGIHYPVIGRGRQKAHHNLAYEIQGRDKFTPRLGTLAQLVEYWRAIDEGMLLISSEMLEDAKESHISRLEKLQIDPDDKIQFLFILRNLVDLAPSGYAQRVKHGRKTFDFDTFFQKQMSQQNVQHYEVITRWATVFGWEKLILRVLDDRYLLNGDVIDDLLALVGIDHADTKSADLSHPGMVNVAPGWKTVEAVRALYGGKHGLPENHPLAGASQHSIAHRKIIGQEAARIGQDLGWNIDRGRYLTLQQAQQCHEIDTENLRALNEKIPTPLPLPPAPTAQAFSAREFLPGAEHIPARQLRQMYDELGEFHRKSSGGTKGR